MSNKWSRCAFIRSLETFPSLIRENFPFSYFKMVEWMFPSGVIPFINWMLSSLNSAFASSVDDTGGFPRFFKNEVQKMN